MPNVTLAPADIQDLITANTYPVEESTRFISRCMEGQYEKAPLPSLAIPGGDAGDLAILYATGEKYGFTVEYEKALDTFLDLIGGSANFSLHTDCYAAGNEGAAGCSCLQQIRLHGEAFGITQEQIVILNSQIERVKKEGAQELLLNGDHQEGAVLIVEGQYGVLPQYQTSSFAGAGVVQVLVFQKTLVDARHKEFARKLVENGGVKLLDGCDEEYLYETLSETTDDHFLETVKRITPGLPLYLVRFDEAGEFTVEEQGVV
ncbi:hypothetical protein HGA88_00150 [Candidatus Roizmanbacteria bacterium]|nr:hypothetical protein [Candidatus Roizmanbacteria bacterium]